MGNRYFTVSHALAHLGMFLGDFMPCNESFSLGNIKPLPPRISPLTFYIIREKCTFLHAFLITPIPAFNGYAIRLRGINQIRLCSVPLPFLSCGGMECIIRGFPRGPQSFTPGSALIHFDATYIEQTYIVKSHIG